MRGAAVVAELRAEGIADEHLAALETPAGLDIGARTPEEIALSIFARIIAVRRREPTVAVRVVAPAEVLATAIDPVCGMAVAATERTPHVDHDDRRLYFCCEGCRTAFEHEPARYAHRTLTLFVGSGHAHSAVSRVGSGTTRSRRQCTWGPPLPRDGRSGSRSGSS